MRLLFKGGVYFFGKPTDINNGWIRYVWAIQWQLLDAVCSTCNLSVPFSAMERSRTTWTALALTWWMSSEMIHASVCAVNTIHGYHSRAVFILLKTSDRAATIWGQQLFEGSDYSRVASIWRNMVSTKQRFLRGTVIWDTQLSWLYSLDILSSDTACRQQKCIKFQIQSSTTLFYTCTHLVLQEQNIDKQYHDWTGKGWFIPGTGTCMYTQCFLSPVRDLFRLTLQLHVTITRKCRTLWGRAWASWYRNIIALTSEVTQ